LLLVGNDIVDLKTPATQNKNSDTRFINRVFTPYEQEIIHSSKIANRTLWLLWAAKETAYKLFSKLSAPPVFSHRSFQCHIDKTNARQTDFSITVSYDGQDIVVDLLTTDLYVHAQSSTGDGSSHFTDTGIKKLSPNDTLRWNDQEWMESHFTEAERAAIHNVESALVRFYCKQHLSKLTGIPGEQWEIIRPTCENKPQPPYLTLDGRHTDFDVSLSHHGAWLAWMLSFPNR